MKTSNKLLVGLLMLVLLSIVSFFIAAKFNLSEKVMVGEGEIVSVKRTLTGFTKVRSMEGNVRFYISQGPAYMVEVKTYPNVIPEIKTTIEDGTLVIQNDKHLSGSDHNKIEVHISMPRVESLDFSHGGYLEAMGLSGDALEIIFSHGMCKADLHYKSIKCNSSAGTSLELKGSADVAEFDCSSGTEIKAENLAVKKCSINASSGSQLSVNVSEEIKGELSSGSEVDYAGNPDVKHLTVSSGGAISKK